MYEHLYCLDLPYKYTLQQESIHSYFNLNNIMLSLFFYITSVVFFMAFIGRHRMHYVIRNRICNNRRITLYDIFLFIVSRKHNIQKLALKTNSIQVLHETLQNNNVLPFYRSQVRCFCMAIRRRFPVYF